MNYPSLFSPLKVGPYQLQHRLALAPLTRMRAAKPSLAPRPLNAEYYAQRATPGGLLIAEASPVMETGFGSPGVPGIYTEQQIAGWREVVDAVHARGGIIFLQLWHVGRVSHSSFQPGGVLPVAPSAVPIADLKTGTADGKAVSYETPRALETVRNPRRGRRLSAGGEECARRRLRRRRDSRRQRLSDRAIPAVAHQSAHRSVWRLDPEPRALPDGGDEGRGRRLGRRPRRRAAVALWRRQWQRRAGPDAALHVCGRAAQPARPGLSAFHRAALLAAPAAPRSTIRTCRRRWCCSARSGRAC